MSALDETRRSWDFATRVHNAHKADQAGFLRRSTTLFDDEVELVGDVSGKRLLHTLCNAGQDTLSWSKRGARVTGVDLSDEAIAFARQLSEDSGIPGDFRRAEVLEFLESTADQYDVVVGTYGCLGWIEDLPRYFRGVARVLVPGGRAVILDFHPLVWSFDSELRFTADPYFSDRPFDSPVSDYVGEAGGALSPSGHLEVESVPNPHVARSWQHTVAEQLSAVARAGLVIERVVELPYANGCKVSPGLVPEGRRYVAPAGLPAPPLMLGFVANRP